MGRSARPAKKKASKVRHLEKFQSETPLQVKKVQPAATSRLKNKETAPRRAGKDKGQGKRMVEHLETHRNRAEPSTVRDMIAAGADLNVRGKRRTSALMYACRHRCAEIVDLLVSAGANLNLKDGANGWSALCEACMRMGGHDVDGEIVQRLIDAGADLNQVDKGGRTVLMNVCYYPNEEAVRRLIGGGADMDIVDDEYGATALHLACIQGFALGVRMLVDAGASVDIRSKDGKCPVDEVSVKSNKLPDKSDDSIEEILAIFTGRDR